MELKMCSKGHHYDPSVSSTCPQCAAEAAASSMWNDSMFQGYGETEPVEEMGDYGATEPVGGGGNYGATEPVDAVEGYGATEPVYSSGNMSQGINQSFDNRFGETMPPDDNGFETSDFFRGGSKVEEYDDATMPVIVNDVAGFTPVVGWLVCVDGPAKGSDYRIRSGCNYIGRGEHMDICIKGDNTIGRERHAMIAYDMEERVFFFGPISGKSIVRLNGKMVMAPMEVHAYDILKIGSTKLMFVPLCGERFNWDV